MKASQFSVKIKTADFRGKTSTRTYTEIKDGLGYEVVGNGDSDTAVLIDNWARALTNISANTYDGQAIVIGQANVAEVFVE